MKIISANNEPRDEKVQMRPHQRLLSFLFDCAHSQNLRRTSTEAYSCRTNQDGTKEWGMGVCCSTFYLDCVAAAATKQNVFLLLGLHLEAKYAGLYSYAAEHHAR